MPATRRPRNTPKKFFVPLGLLGVAAILLAIILIPRRDGARPTSAGSTLNSETPFSSPSPLPRSSTNSYQLVIGKLHITAPLVLDVSGTDENAYLTALEHGVAQYAGTAHPGQIGNMVIFGHSSYYRNKPGDYKEVFKQLNKLVVGDPILVKRDGQPLFTYKVTGSRIVAADDLSVLKSAPVADLTLLTCWPPGTTDKRYVVTAQLSPSSRLQ